MTHIQQAASASGWSASILNTGSTNTACSIADYYVYFGPKGDHCWKEKP